MREALAGDAFELVSGPVTQRRSGQATVLVMPASADAACQAELLLRDPEVSLLLIEPRRCDTALVELHPRRRSLGVIDAAGIVDAVLSASAWEARWSLEGGR